MEGVLLRKEYAHQHREQECVAFDTAERFSFESLKGLSFAFYDSLIGRSFNIQLCNQVQVTLGDFTEIDRNLDRYSSNIQGVYTEFLIDRFFDGEKYKKDDTRTWSSGNLVKFRMKHMHGSQGPPCIAPLTLRAGVSKHAPEYGGRESSINIYCGGCPEWPAGWQNDPTTSLEKLCNRYVDQGINYGRPSDRDFHGNKVTQTDPNGCVCGAREVGTCGMDFNITLSCPKAGKAFNEEKRLYLLIAFVVGMITIAIVLTFMSVRKKRMSTGRSGRSLTIVLNWLLRVFNVTDTFRNTIRNLMAVFVPLDVIPPQPAETGQSEDGESMHTATVHTTSK